MGWPRFVALSIRLVAGLSAFLYAAVLVVDPYDTVWFSPPLDRAPTATNQRFAFPALARKEKFDSAIVGTSMTRLLNPADIDPLLDARFVNLSMNSGTAWEQAQILDVFRRAQAKHGRAPRYVLFGIDTVWCETGKDYEKLTPRPFPEWMYDDNRWNDLLHLFNFPTLEEVGRQFGHVTGIRRSRYGPDGYTNFLPSPDRYDLARAQKHIYGNSRPAVPAPPDPAALEAALASYKAAYPTHPLLADALRSLPDATQKILMMVPYHMQMQLRGGLDSAVHWQACKNALARIAEATPNALLVDFMIPSRITREDRNYWDAQHYSTDIARELARMVAQAVRTRRPEPQVYAILVPKTPVAGR